MEKIADVKDFIEQHRITDEKYKEFRMVAKKLGKVLIAK